MRKKISIKVDIFFQFLIAFVILSILALVLYTWQISVVRIVLGALFILFLPGYSLMVALFPQRGIINISQRIFISVGLSITIMGLLGLILHYVSLRVQVTSIYCLGSLTILLFFGIAYFRQHRLPRDSRFMLFVEFDLSHWVAMKQPDRTLSVALIFSFLIATSSLAYGTTRHFSEEKLTEFYILGSDGLASGYSKRVMMGKPITLIIGAVNHEQRDVEYRIEKKYGSESKQIATFQLEHDQKWEEQYSFVLTKPWERQRVEFILYINGSNVPYRSLHLWITAIENLPSLKE